MIDFKIHLHETKYRTKPLESIGFISNEIVLRETQLNSKELAKSVARDGQTALLGLMKVAYRNLTNFKGQQVLMLDFDNTDITRNKTTGINYITIENILEEPFIRENASFVYKTFNYSEDWQKFRVVFILNEELQTAREVYRAYDYLLSLYPQADKSCKDPTRLFFGGTEFIEIDFENTLDTRILFNTQDYSLVETTQQNTQSITTEITNNEYLIKNLIQEEKIEELKEIFQERYKVKLHSKVQAKRYLKSINMFEFFGITSNPFHDFFHDEIAPSSSIFEMQEGSIYLYKCHSTSHQFIGDITVVVSRLLNVGFIRALDFLIEITGIEIVITEQIAELREYCDLALDILMSEDLKETYPHIHGIFWRYKTDVYTILNIFKENVYEDEFGELRCLTWLSVRSLSARLYGTPSKYNKVSQILNLLVYTQWIDKLDEDKIPLELFNQIKQHQKISNNNKRSNVFELLLLNDGFIDNLNEQCDTMTDVGFTMKGLSQEYMVRTHNKDVADKLYVQDKRKKISAKSEKFIKFVTLEILQTIEEDGFAIEKEIMDRAKRRYRKSFTEMKYKQTISEILIAYNLERIRLNKKVKAQFNVTHLLPKSMPMILKSKDL